MPKVKTKSGKTKKFPYTKSGKKAAKKYAKTYAKVFGMKGMGKMS